MQTENVEIETKSAEKILQKPIKEQKPSQQGATPTEILANQVAALQTECASYKQKYAEIEEKLKESEAEAEALKSELGKVQSNIEKVEADKKKNEIEALIKQAEETGFLAPKDEEARTDLLAIATTNIETAKRLIAKHKPEQKKNDKLTNTNKSNNKTDIADEAGKFWKLINKK